MDYFLPIAAEVAIAEIVCEDVDDVRFFGRLGSCAGEIQCEGTEEGGEKVKRFDFHGDDRNGKILRQRDTL